MNKNLLTYTIISFIIISFFGFNFLFSLLGNILILLFLTPLLLLGIALLGINSFKSKIKVCKNCGATILSDGENCLYCGSSFNGIENNKKFSEDASKETIEIEAEEVN
tara:strand:+ start:174 stop:497 length:324 start_codon:yes stop_codon:yes gene_type:complete